ncbi:MAG: HEAT repeat domain-containing protein [Planctomycetes bacterium]|nr:HEAT repeat domain-containing protein [Planctomycetota bacterium]
MNSSSESLIETATDPGASSFRRRRAIDELTRSGDPRAAETLAGLLEDEDRYLLREVVTALGRLGDRRAVEPLLAALQHEDDGMRREIVEALGQLGDPRAVEPLESLVENDSYSVRFAAKGALQRIAELAPAGDQQTESREQAEPQEDVASQENVEPQEDVAPREEDAEPPVTDEPRETDEMLVLKPSPAEAPEEIVPLVSAPARVRPPVPAAPSTAISRADTSHQTEDDDVLEPADCFVVHVDDRFSWRRAPRMAVFFGDDLADVEAAYEQLLDRQRQLLAVEREDRQVITKLNLQRADKEDDLARAGGTITTAGNRVRKFSRRLARNIGEKNTLETQAASVWHRLTAAFSPDRQRKLQKSLTDVNSRIGQLRQKVAGARGEQADAEQCHRELFEPIERLTKQAEESAAKEEAASTAVREADDRIDSLVLAVLRGRLPEELGARFAQFGPLCRDPEFFRVCTHQLMQALAELDEHTSRLESFTAEAEQAEDIVRAAQDGLGGAIADGFRVTTVEKRAAARLHGSIRFEEEHGFISGYSGASGSATGTGTGEALYAVDEIDWRASPELADRLARMTEAWTRLGQIIGRRQTLLALEAATRRRIDQYVHFIRSQLERDFRET